MTVVPRIPGFSSALDNTGQIQIVLACAVQSDISFYAETSDVTMSEFLQIPVGESVFATERVTWLEGKSVTLARMYFHRGYRVMTYY